MLRIVCRRAWLGCAALLCAIAGARADDTDTRRLLFFSGVDVSTISAFSWAGADASLRGPLDRSGPVLRLMGGLGRYDYDKSGAPDGKVLGTVSMGEVLAGWRHIGGTLCLAAFGGFMIEDHVLDVEDPTNKVKGTETGAKLVGELFWRPSPRTQVEATLSYSTVFDAYRARLAGGYAVWRGAVVGPEAEAFGNAGSDQVRLGLFVSDVAWRAWRFKASAGALHDRHDLGAYGRFGVDLTF